MGDGRSGSWSRSSASKVVGVAFLALLGTLLYLGWDIYSFSKRPMEIPQAQYILVLGARTYGTQPSPAFRERILYAVELYRQGKASRIILTGRPGNPPQALVAKETAMALGIPEANLLVETNSDTTLENLRQARNLIKDPHMDTILIVSDPLHLRRAMRISEDLGLKAHPAPTPSTRYRSGLSQAKFLVRETLAYFKYQVRRIFL